MNLYLIKKCMSNGIREIFNREMEMLTLFYSLYTFSVSLWYNFLSLYLGLFLKTEEVGLLFSLLSIGGMFSFVLGVFADSFGRKPAIIVSTLGTAGIAVVLGFFKDIYMLIIAFLILGLCSQSLRSVLRVFIAEKLPERLKGRGIGVIFTIIALTAAIAPGVGGILIGAHGFPNVLLFSFFLMIISLISLTSVRETISMMKRPHNAVKPLKALALVPKLRRSLVFYYVAWCIYCFGTEMVIPYVSLFADKVLELKVDEIGLMFTLSSLLALPSYYVGGALADKLGYRLTLAMSLGTNSLLLTLMAFSPHKGMAIACWALSSFVFMAHESPEISLLIELAPPEARSTAMSLLGTLISLAVIPSPLIGGFLWSLIGPRSVYLVMCLFSFFSLVFLALTK
ncbi:MFS transporter [Candidatus Methanodesulfokora washburnensis]|jgi:MFS family permease|uniref:MFS transporter n=1 Tax=Candidatus Methanodesulfokora washburnensis TaxID=2478471 RepID=A0A3R9PI47_9CREN|nr:MFS transporter [Candidatus Methanodesulfokores washburnensis]RSN74108.1 MFS transporter [Candidatus Methanodesulfokores washburnensis]